MKLIKFKENIRILASNNHFVAIAIALLYGFRGLLINRKGSKDHLKSTFSLAIKSSFIHGRPMNITIEPTNMCNLQCPVCETGAGILGRENGHMSLTVFKSIISKISAHTNTLMFYFMGEPFLNKNAYKMIRLAKDQGIPFVDTCTNGDAINPEKLIDCGIDRVSFQIGGMTQKTHEIYRINSNIERVFKNMRETIRLKKLSGSKIQINCGFILMKHNEHEMELFKKTMREYGVDHAQIIDPCIRNTDQIHMLPTDKSHWIYDPKSIAQGTIKPKDLPNNSCPWIYYSLVIHVNGNVVPCCRDPKGEEIVGNIYTQSLDEVWNGEKFRAFRQRINTDQSNVGICRLCSAYPASAIN